MAVDILTDLRNCSESLKTSIVLPDKDNGIDDISINKFVELIKPPMVAVRDQYGYIHDAATIAIKCPLGHVHKYYITELNNIKCITCSNSGKFSLMVRELLEQLFKSPFILTSKKSDTDEYTNPIIKLNVICSKVVGVDNIIDAPPNQAIIINLHNTTSLKKVKRSLYTLLSTRLSHFTTEHRASLLTLAPAPSESTRRIFPKTKLPFTNELASTAINAAKYHGANALAVQMRMNIVKDTNVLCLENC